MTLRSPALPRFDLAQAPTYASGRTANTVVASFASGRQLTLQLGRGRSYPGVRGSAPDTRAFYELALALDPSLDVIDFGSGSGEGCRLLAQHFASVIGVESNVTALAFAREYAPAIQFQFRDLAQPWGEPLADLTVVVDVLSQVRDPQSVLIAAKSALRRNGRIIVAEPLAAIGQRIEAPQRRTFTERALHGLLTRAGFTAVTRLHGAFGFVAFVAEVGTAVSEVSCLSYAVARARQGAHSELEACLQLLDTRVVHEARLALAELSYSASRCDELVGHLMKACKLEPQDSRVWTRLACVALELRDHSRATHLAIEALEREPCDAEAAKVLAESLQLAGHPQTQEAWQVASRLAPDNAAIAVRFAQVSAADADYASGIEALARAIAYEPNDAELRVVLAWLLLLDQRVSEAIAQARRAWNLAPSYAGIHELWQAIGVVVPSILVEA
ncbi:MAG TPA: methyltransferase domain-containing protein [Polyangiaceae bacterium]|jgi:tetratricopeptide (TPR) repeat protein|nr:methyltransferase domain-containing protein [Polyangiaceae bacterium]